MGEDRDQSRQNEDTIPAPPGAAPSAPPALLRLRTFGDLALDRVGPDGELLPTGIVGKPLMLLAYLALLPERRAGREHLMDVFWDASDPFHARNSLRQALHALRQRLGVDAFRSFAERVELRLPLDIDCDRFEAALAAGDLRYAWSLYTGHFIPQHAKWATTEFERWTATRRTRLRRAWLLVGEELVERALADGDHAEAAAILPLLCDDAPDRLDLSRARIVALLGAGHRTEARAQAVILERQYQRSGDAIDAAARRVLDRALRQHVLFYNLGDEPWRIRCEGRQDVVAVVMRAWQRAVDGRAQVVTISGDPGSGRTRLLEEVAQRLLANGHAPVMLRRDRTVTAARPRAVSALADAIADQVGVRAGSAGVSPDAAALLVALAPRLAAVFRSATPRPLDEGEGGRAVAGALAELLQVTSDEEPVALLIDDLAPDDLDGWELLARLVERMADCPVLVVVASDRLPERPRVAPQAQHLSLRPLTLEEVERMLRGLMDGAGAGGEGDAMSITREGQGSPAAPLDLVSRAAPLLHAATGGLPARLVAVLTSALDAPESVGAGSVSRWRLSADALKVLVEALVERLDRDAAPSGPP